MLVFFFKQKTAYEMRISDWSSDVCSSDLLEAEREDYRAIAVRRVRLGLLLSEIGQANDVQISQQEMSRLIAKSAQQYPPEDQKRFLEDIQPTAMATEQIRAPLYEKKVGDFLLEKAKIPNRNVPPTRQKQRKEDEKRTKYGRSP